MGFRRRDKMRFNQAVGRFRRQYLAGVREHIVEETLKMIRDIARAQAPVDTGELKASIEMSIDPDGLSGSVVVNAEHGIYVNFGTGIHAVNGNGRKTPWTYYNDRLGRFVTTRGQQAQPFFSNAFDRAATYFETECNRLDA